MSGTVTNRDDKAKVGVLTRLDSLPFRSLEIHVHNGGPPINWGQLYLLSRLCFYESQLVRLNKMVSANTKRNYFS